MAPILAAELQLLEHAALEWMGCNVEAHKPCTGLIIRPTGAFLELVWVIWNEVSTGPVRLEHRREFGDRFWIARGR